MTFAVKAPKRKEKDTFAVEKPKEENEYDKQANKFLNDTNTKFSVRFVKHDKYFPDDKETRDIYRFTLIKDGKKYSGTFGQSIASQGKEPRPYDVLSSLGADYGDENETWEEFADNFGYNRDSHSGRKIYQAVIKERKGLKELYSEEELNKMQEIQ